MIEKRHPLSALSAKLAIKERHSLDAHRPIHLITYESIVHGERLRLTLFHSSRDHMHCSRVRVFSRENWELKVHFLHLFETIAKSEFIISGVRVNSRTFWNSDFIFGTFPKQLHSQSSFSDLGGTWSSDNRNSAKLRV